MLIVDHVLTDNLCNLRCTYCPCDVTQLQRSSQQIRTRIGRDGPPPEKITNFLERTVKVIKRIDKQVKAPILKLSGGEIFLVPEFMSFLPELCKCFDVIQILTNGTRLSDLIVAELKTHKNVYLQISLDGHTYEMNQFRFISPRIFKTTIDGLLRSVRAKIPLEINTVLSSANISGFWDFIRFLNEISPEHTMVWPFPVRGNQEMLASRNQVEEFCQRMPTEYADHEAFLPPKAYMTALCEFMQTGDRCSGCSVPYAVIGSNGDGTIDACTCGPVQILGNVLHGDGSILLERIEKDVCYKKLLNRTLMPRCCDDCFTHYEIINLFVEGKVSEQELARLPFFGTPQIFVALRAVREKVMAALPEAR